jgi:hypothetical protein
LTELGVFTRLPTNPWKPMSDFLLAFPALRRQTCFH